MAGNCLIGIIADDKKCGISFYAKKLSKYIGAKIITSKDVNDFDIVSIQHDIGLFNPKELYSLLSKIKPPCCVTYHSIREGDFYLLGMPWVNHCVVHTEESKKFVKIPCTVIPHGCEWKNERPKNKKYVLNFGFGIHYKGYENLKNIAKEVKNKINIEFISIISPPERGRSYSFKDKNVTVVDRFMEEEELEEYILNSAVCLFPYEVDFYGASGAARTAMSYHVPVVASNSHLFDGLPIIRENQSENIIRLIKDDQFYYDTVKSADEYIKLCSWEKVSFEYMKLFDSIVKRSST